MSSRFDLLAQEIFQKDFAQCSTEELQQYAEAHPYFAAAQFLWIKMLQVQRDSTYKAKAQKAALYYHLPVGFESFLSATDETFELPQPEKDVLDPSFIEAQPGDVKQNTEPVTESIKAESLPTANLPPLPGLNKAIAPDTLSFEPFHTVDYFASQGIKLSQEEIPGDKFGKQLKSFTEWLKTMKKLPAGEQAKNMDPQAEQKVENMAAHSVNNADVLTETMAEIWIKQGQLSKAAEVYRKLSLLHPSKKAYFATKLENLKQ